MMAKPPPITLVGIAADIIAGTHLPTFTLDQATSLALPKAASCGKTELSAVGALVQIEVTPPPIARETAEAIGRRISDTWGAIKAHDSTGTVTVQENAEGFWYAIWTDHAGVVIAESCPVTSAEQARGLVNWMRDNAAAAREQVIEGEHARALEREGNTTITLSVKVVGEHARALEREATDPTEPPPGLEHLGPLPSPFNGPRIEERAPPDDDAGWTTRSIRAALRGLRGRR